MENRYVLLVVDDEEGPRKSLEMTFRRDFTVVLARSGEEALELAAKTPPDVAILDLRMPGISGIDVLEQLKRRDPCIEAVILTAFETAETTKAALRLGAVDYLAKPFDLAVLREAVRRALQIRLAALGGQRIARQEEAGAVLETEARFAEAHRLATEFYAGIIHDINNPLTAIIGHLDLALLMVENAANGKELRLQDIRHHLVMAQSNVTHAAKISGRYLQTARSINVAGSFSELGTFLRDFQAMLASHPSAKNRTLVLEDAVPEMNFFGDTVLLMQILSNLVVNGFHASPHQGQVVLRAARAPGWKLCEEAKHRVVAGNRRQAHYPETLLIEVVDQGQGMTSEVLHKAFTPFFTTKGVLGTGMGLPMVARITEHLNGWVSLESHPGSGTRAVLALPLLGPESNGVYRLGA